VSQDAEQIADLLKQLGYPNTSSFVQAKLAALSKSSNDVVLVAEMGSRVAGVGHLHIAELFHQPGYSGRVMALVVSDAYRRHQVGRMLMMSLETIARNSGCIKMEVTSGIQRDDAHAFYKSLGYTEKPRRFIKFLE
jgi:GNAT superfamily N-acetyltransferase